VTCPFIRHIEIALISLSHSLQFHLVVNLINITSTTNNKILNYLFVIGVENLDVLCVTLYSGTPLEVLDKSSRKRRAQEYSLRSDSMNKFQV